jgi:hypothetical protein
MASRLLHQLEMPPTRRFTPACASFASALVSGADTWTDEKAEESYRPGPTPHHTANNNNSRVNANQSPEIHKPHTKPATKGN